MEQVRSLNKNNVVDVVIEDLTQDGEGIGKAEGFPLFIKDAVIGDRVRVKVIKVKKSYGYARLLEVLEASPDRVTPRCPAARPCGGCTLQHISYEKQLEYKYRKVANCLKRIGKIPDPESLMEPIVGMLTKEEADSLDNYLISANVCESGPWHYRNKAQFPVSAGRDNGIHIGFYAGRTHTVIEQPECCLQTAKTASICESIRNFMQAFGVTAYNETTHSGVVRHILIRRGDATGQILVCLVINAARLPHAEELAQSLRQIEGVCSVAYNVNREKTNRILGERTVTVWGTECIEDKIGEVRYRIHPKSFFQVNPVQTRALYAKALEYAGLTGRETVWDLYCGIGTISLFLAQKARQVYGVEIVPEAVENARQNAQLNGVHNADFFVGKAEEVLPQEYDRHGIRADVIVVDPPRKGCDPRALQTMVKMQPERIVYVSCDPATLARDVNWLTQQGYELCRICPIDMFPQGGHVETVVLLSKLHSNRHIDIDLDMSELDLTAAESKATYEEIKEYILEKHGIKVSSLYIAQIKHKCGLDVGKNYNLSKKENAKVPQCPPEKEKVIREALEHFQMI